MIMPMPIPIMSPWCAFQNVLMLVFMMSPCHQCGDCLGFNTLEDLTEGFVVAENYSSVEALSATTKWKVIVEDLI